jgi:hypothetical protein
VATLKSKYHEFLDVEAAAAERAADQQVMEEKSALPDDGTDDDEDDEVAISDPESELKAKSQKPFAAGRGSPAFQLMDRYKDVAPVPPDVITLRAYHALLTDLHVNQRNEMFNETDADKFTMALIDEAMEARSLNCHLRGVDHDACWADAELPQGVPGPSAETTKAMLASMDVGTAIARLMRLRHTMEARMHFLELQRRLVEKRLQMQQKLFGN